MRCRRSLRAISGKNNHIKKAWALRSHVASMRVPLPSGWRMKSKNPSIAGFSPAWSVQRRVGSKAVVCETRVMRLPETSATMRTSLPL